MNLKFLLKKCLLNYHDVNNHKVSKLANNSQECINNSIFFAVKGEKEDGHKYIHEAIIKGAKTIIYTDDVLKENYYINYLKVTDIKLIMAKMASVFYKDISRKFYMVGITGTNGKSSIAQILFDYLNSVNKKVVLIGTNGIYFNDEKLETVNTTPNILTIYEVLNRYYRQGARFVVMEVSSIAIREKRVLDLDFNSIIFTNLGYDHLDYHQSIIDYKFSKGLFLASLGYHKNKVIILNKDDKNYDFYHSISNARGLSYGIIQNGDVKAFQITRNMMNTKFVIKDGKNNYLFKTNLIGDFNISNTLASYLALKEIHLSKEFSNFMKFYLPLDGRMNFIKWHNKMILIDFAHTPDGVKVVLELLKTHYSSVWVVIGCGGNRDQSKRRIMGKLCIDFADKVIFTNDNPRDEDEHLIMNDIISDIKDFDFQIIYDRKEAIEKALKESEDESVVAILGKGSEVGQIIKGKIYPFSDKEVVYNYINSVNKKSG